MGKGKSRGRKNREEGKENGEKKKEETEVEEGEGKKEEEEWRKGWRRKKSPCLLVWASFLCWTGAGRWIRHLESQKEN